MGFIIAFSISMILLILTIWYAVKHPKKRIVGLTLGTYAMLFAMVFPFGAQNTLWGFLQNFFLSIVKTAQIFGLNSEFSAEVDLFDTPQWFAWTYSIWLSILYTAAPILTASFLLTYSRRTSNWFRWKLNRRQEVWIFSGPSEKALLFAESVLQDRNEDVCAVFCDVGDENYERVVQIGAIAVKKSIDELDEEYFNRKRKPATLLFMAEDEERSLEQTLSFVQKRKEEITKPVLIYCFNSRSEAGLMLNAMDKQTNNLIQFRRIAENRAVVYQELLLVAEDLKKRSKQPDETLHFLIVGCGWIGTELLKALLWCFVRYKLVIDVIDKENADRRIYRSCPGLKGGKGDRFKINFISNEDIRTFDISKIENAIAIDYTFLALGSDMANLECAVYLRQAFRRLHRQSPCADIESSLTMPAIHVVINNPRNKNLDLIDHKVSYDICSFIGGQNYYTTQTLLDYDLEKRALLCHLGWILFYAYIDAGNKTQNKKDKAQTTIDRINKFVHNALEDGNLPIQSHAQWRQLGLNNDVISDFYNDDYNSWSSRARAVFDKCDSQFAHSAAVEHKRWIMYMLTEGYQYGEVTDHIAKLHKDIGKDADDARDEEYQKILEGITHR